MLALLTPPTIVLVGYWNPAILQPDWIVRELFGDKSTSHIPVKMEFSPIPGLPPRFTIERLTIIPHQNRVAITPASLSEADLKNAEDKARKLLDLLPRTPLKAFGQNFEFIEGNPTHPLIEIFDLKDNLSDCVDFYCAPKSTTVAIAIPINDAVLNYTRTFYDGNFVMKFNFHYEAPNSSHAVARLNGEFIKNFQRVSKLLNNYKVDLSGIMEWRNE